MFNKNLRYYRLKNKMTKEELGDMVNISSMDISNYENGDIRPNMNIIKKLASALNIKVTDFLKERNGNLIFVHGDFFNNSKVSKNEQEYIRESVEEYLTRFFTVVEILGGEILTDAPECHKLELSGNVEKDALAMSTYMGTAEFGPVGNLVEILENKGILVCFCYIDNDAFYGMNGLVNGRPYIAINANMSTERIRSTIVNKMAYSIFIWDENMEEDIVEKTVKAIGDAFLRECRKNEVFENENEEPMLFSKLVFRAVCEDKISIQRGAELLNRTFSYVSEHCFTKSNRYI